VYVPKGVEVPLPLQAYFRINGENTGQFERTLIVVDEGAKVHYIEGCTAPIYATDSLHAAVVEVIALPGSKVRYTTIQNWSNDVYNLVTKRAHAHENSTVEWIDANTGCLTGDALVLKNNDVVPIASIKPGDFVYSLTPEFEIQRSRVAATRENPPEQAYNLVLRNHREVRATANHPFLVARKVGRTRRMAWLPLAAIVPGDEVAIAGTVPDRGEPKQFEPIVRRPRSRKAFTAPEQSTDELLWVLGFYLGDGFLDGANRVIFAVPDSDPACERLRERLVSTFGLETTRGQGVQLRVASAPFVDWLVANGFGGNADTKRVPDWVFRLPHPQKKAFIDGYIAADGHVRKGHKNVSIASASWELLEQVKALGISAGLNPTKVSTWTRFEKLPLGTREKSYTTSFLYFGDETLESPVHFVPILTIEPAGEHVTYDIEVEGTANFIANGIFAHNSKLTMKYPAIYLRGEGATADIISVAVAGKGQHQDTGAKAVHLAPNTRSRIVSKSVSKDGGRATYRGNLKVAPGATNVVASVRCDALMLDDQSRSDTYPYIDIQEDDTTMSHEATVGKVSADQVFYLMSRGLTENEATNLIVQGFLEVFTKELPMEYAIEFNRLVKLEMEGSLG
jgi:Fe-S cluster assembly scaffold protein SufB